ncbi:MAG: TetR family transcriptional regulator [Actinobacteria bacterium]|nr:TetR family transcriptional regulator [Actinomycetota bacterium]
MGEQKTARPGTRQDRRKAATRAKILEAAERLFGERGYTQTSIEDIAELADVAVRTIYMHFPTKAAIMLAAFDAWVDVFVEAVLQRPVDEPVVETVRAALDAVEAAGWVDHPENDDTPVHPMVEHLHSGSPDVAGHVLQRWMREMDRIARDAIDRGDDEPVSLRPQARATAVFAAWIASLSATGGRLQGRALPEDATGQGVGISVLALITDGTL